MTQPGDEMQRLAGLENRSLTTLIARDDFRIGAWRDLVALLREITGRGAEDTPLLETARRCAEEGAWHIRVFVDHDASFLPAPRETLLEIARELEALLPSPVKGPNRRRIASGMSNASAGRPEPA